MKIYLQNTDGNWTLHEGTLTKLGAELTKRSIRIGECATIGARATIGEWASIKVSYNCIVMGSLGSRQAPMTAYAHKDTIWIGTGCFLGPIAEFEAQVKKVHGGNRHEAEYLCALKYVREEFAIKG